MRCTGIYEQKLIVKHVLQETDLQFSIGLLLEYIQETIF